MSLKKLSFPIFMVVTIFLGVFWVRPVVMSVLGKRDELAARNADLRAIGMTEQNLDSLFASRESLLGTDAGRAVYEYLPKSVSQERVVDIFNYYAMQSGAVINKITFEDDSKVAADLANSGLVTEGMQPDSSGTTAELVPPTPPTPNSFTLRADIQGSYESIGSFLREVSHPGRSHELVSFSIEKKVTVGVDANGQPAPDSGILSGSFSAKFFYLPEKQYPRGYLLPVFNGSAFNLGSVSELIAKEKSVPALSEPGNTGRVNPFSF